MITANAEKEAVREFRRLRAQRGLPWWQALFLVPFWLAVAFLSGASLWRLAWLSPISTREMAFLGGFGIGAVFFAAMPMRPLYVFGHEASHWLAAKLTLHATGRFRCGMRKGSVEIPSPTGFIALAPYFVPFYFLLSGIVLAIPAFLQPRLPSWFWNAAATWMGLMYAHHWILGAIALRHGQEDLKYCGRVLSFCIILGANLLVAFCLAALCSYSPANLWRIPWTVCRGCF